jgi:hypothetical protein
MVPMDARPKEHLTLVWCSDEYDSRAHTLYMQSVARQFTGYCPDYGRVIGHDVFNDKPVALLHLPHRLHKIRQKLEGFDRSGREDWIPHVTQVGPEAYPVGHLFTFTHVEWRP